MPRFALTVVAVEDNTDTASQKWLDDQAISVVDQLKHWQHTHPHVRPGLYVRLEMNRRGRITPIELVVASALPPPTMVTVTPDLYRVHIGQELDTCPFSDLRHALETAQIELWEDTMATDTTKADAIRAMREDGLPENAPKVEMPSELGSERYCASCNVKRSPGQTWCWECGSRLRSPPPRRPQLGDHITLTKHLPIVSDSTGTYQCPILPGGKGIVTDLTPNDKLVVVDFDAYGRWIVSLDSLKVD